MGIAPDNREDSARRCAENKRKGITVLIHTHRTPDAIAGIDPSGNRLIRIRTFAEGETVVYEAAEEHALVGEGFMPQRADDHRRWNGRTESPLHRPSSDRRRSRILPAPRSRRGSPGFSSIHKKTGTINYFTSRSHPGGSEPDSYWENLWITRCSRSLALALSPNPGRRGPISEGRRNLVLPGSFWSPCRTQRSPFHISLEIIALADPEQGIVGKFGIGVLFKEVFKRFPSFHTSSLKSP